MNQKGDRKYWYVYSVKYLCGIFEPFPNVMHWTEINIHNPSDAQKARVTKKFLAAGTQEHPTGPVAKEKMILPPNGAFEIDCNEIYDKLGLPVSLATKGFVEITSNRELQVVAVYDKCTKQPHTDIFERTEADVTIEVDTNLDGTFDFEADLAMVGRTVIKKSDQRLFGECFYIGTEIIDMSLSVEEVTAARQVAGSVVTELDPRELPIDLTTMRIDQSPVYPTRGKIVGPVDERLRHQEGITSFFEVFFNVTLPPELRELHGELVNNRALLLEADLTQVEPPEPPTDDGKNQYRSPRAAIPLVSTASGQVVARIKAHHHTPNPEPKPKPKPKKHPPFPCESASIDVEYVKPTLRIPRKAKKDEA